MPKVYGDYDVKGIVKDGKLKLNKKTGNFTIDRYNGAKAEEKNGRLYLYAPSLEEINRNTGKSVKPSGAKEWRGRAGKQVQPSGYADESGRHENLTVKERLKKAYKKTK